MEKDQKKELIKGAANLFLAAMAFAAGKTMIKNGQAHLHKAKLPSGKTK